MTDPTYTTGPTKDIDGRELKVGQRVAYSVGGRGHQHDLLTGEVILVDGEDKWGHYPPGLYKQWPDGYSFLAASGKVTIKAQQKGRKGVIRSGRDTVIITESSAN